MRMTSLKTYTDIRDLSRFIPSKKLNCVIDRVNGMSIVEVADFRNC